MTSSQVMLAGSEKKGWLNKKGKSNRIWRQRWFVLEDNLLSYYKTLQVHMRPLTPTHSLARSLSLTT